MTAATLDGRIFEPPSVNPPWLRPLVVAIVVALHVAAFSILTLAPTPPEPPSEVTVDVQTEAPPQEALRAPEAAPSPAPQDAAPPETAKEPEAITPPPVAEAPPPVPTPPVAEAQPPEPTPPVAEAAPPEPTPPVAEAPPPETSPPPSAPVELEPPKPPPPPKATPRTEQPPKPAPKLVRPKSENAARELAPTTAQKSASLEAPRPGASTSAQSSAASAASQSGYISEISAAIRGRLFYPEAARARGAKGVVGVAFTIGASGQLTSFAITRSSGDEDLDAAARTLVRSAHFPPPPGGSVHVATSFNYVP
jgi:protein TonB